MRKKIKTVADSLAAECERVFSDMLSTEHPPISVSRSLFERQGGDLTKLEKWAKAKGWSVKLDRVAETELITVTLSKPPPSLI